MVNDDKRELCLLEVSLLYLRIGFSAKLVLESEQTTDEQSGKNQTSYIQFAEDQRKNWSFDF